MEVPKETEDAQPKTQNEICNNTLAIQIQLQKLSSRIVKLKISNDAMVDEFKEKIKNLKAENIDKAQEISCKLKEFDQIKSKYVNELKLRRDIDSINHTNGEIMEAVERFEKNLADNFDIYKDDLPKLASCYQNADTVYEKLNEEFAKHVEERKYLEEKSTLNEQLYLEQSNKLIEEGKQKQDRIDELKAQLQSKKDINEKLELEYSENCKIKNKNEEEITYYKKMINQHDQDIVTMITHYQNTTGKMKEENRNLSNTNDNLFKMISQLQEDVKSSKTVSDDYSTNLKELMERKTYLCGKVISLETKLINIDTEHVESVQNLENSLEKLKKCKEVLEVKKMSLNEEFDHSKNMIKEAQEENERTQNKLKETKAAYALEKIELQQRNTNRKGELDLLKDELTTIKFKLDDYILLKTELNNINVSRKVDNENSSKIIESLEKEVQLNSDKISTLNSEQNTYISSIDKLEHNLNQIKTNIQSNLDESSKLQKYIADKEEEIKTQNTKYTSLENLKSSYEKSLKNLESDLKTLQQEIDEYESVNDVAVENTSATPNQRNVSSSFGNNFFNSNGSKYTSSESLAALEFDKVQSTTSQRSTSTLNRSSIMFDKYYNKQKLEENMEQQKKKPINNAKTRRLQKKKKSQIIE